MKTLKFIPFLTFAVSIVILLSACRTGYPSPQPVPAAQNLGSLNADLTAVVKLIEPALARIDVVGLGWPHSIWA